MEPTLINYYIRIQFFPPSVFIQRRFLVLGNFYFLTNLGKFIFTSALLMCEYNGLANIKVQIYL